jgi:hypothetical protein
VQGPASVLTLATRAGQPLAYMVLAVIDPPKSPPTPTPPSRTSSPTSGTSPAAPPRERTGDLARRPEIQVPKLPSTSNSGRGRADSIPSIAPPMILEDSVKGTGSKIGVGGKTIIPDAPSERIFTLQERGALLQKVHFSTFMLGYDVYFGTRGELGTHVEDPAATFQVRKRTVSLVAHIDGVTIDGKPIAAGVEVPIEGDVKIEVAGHKLEYHDLRGLQLDGWPYVGEIRRPASSTYMIWGEDYLIGRSRECRVVLPDEPRNDNIHWKPSVGDGATIRARTGEIPKSKFYTDSIMVGSEHASVDLRGAVPKVVCTSKHCYAYVRRQAEVFSLYPTTSAQQPKELELQPGDEILIGNCLFHVGYTAGDAVAPAPAPRIERSEDVSRPDVLRSPDALADQVGGVDFKSLDRDTVPPIERTVSPPIHGAQEAQVLEAPPVNSQVVDAPPPLPNPEPELSQPLPTEEQGTAPYAPAAMPSIPDEAFDEEVQDNGGWDPDDWEPSAGPDPTPAPVEPRLSIDDEAYPVREPPSEADEGGTSVVFIDDREAQFELGRPMHLVLVGWTVNGEVVCGNHRGADLILPENRIRPDQALTPVTYFRLRVRGRKGSIEILAPDELELDGGPPPAVVEDPEAHVLDVIRRDDAGERDFVVSMRLVEDRKLPDPRARFVAIDTDEPLAAALVTRGLPKGAPRTLELGGLTLTLHYDGQAIRVSDYLAAYRLPDGTFRPFLVQRGEERYKTAPEDGAPFEVRAGDRLVIGTSVYVLREE